MIYLSRNDIEKIAEPIIQKYKSLCVPEKYLCYRVDMLELCSILGYAVVYVNITKDGSILGQTSSCQIWTTIQDNSMNDTLFLLDGKTILIEKDLKTDTAMYGRYQFTKCHEAGHLIYKMLFPNEYGCKSGGTPVPQYSKIRKERSRNGIVNWEEWQADVLASVILMPTELIEQGMFWLGLGERIKLLNKVYSPSIYEKFCTLAEMLGASKQALAYRLQRLGMIEHNQLENPYEYLNI